MLSLDFTHKCSQNAGNAISETLNSNIFWRRIPPPGPPYICHHFLGAQMFFSHRGPHTRSAATDLTHSNMIYFYHEKIRNQLKTDLTAFYTFKITKI